MRLTSWLNKGLDWASSDEVMTPQKRVKSMVDKNTSLASVIQGEVWEAAKTAPKGDTPTAKNMGEPTSMETGDGGHVQFGPQPNVIPETHTAPESDEQPPSKEGGAPTPPATSVNPEAPDTLVGALQSAAIVEEHRTLMGTVVEKAAMQASASHAAEASELRRKLEEKQADASEVETLNSALAEAKKEAEEERAARLKHESRVEEVQQELKDATSKCESLERMISDQNSEVAKALQSAQEAQAEAQSACREIQEAKQIAVGKAFIMQRKKKVRRTVSGGPAGRAPNNQALDLVGETGADVLAEKNGLLAQELEQCQAQLKAATAELGDLKKSSSGPSDQLEEKLKVAQEGERERRKGNTPQAIVC
nr:myosin heavy chain-like [Aegilops tauschii subsp. strangulata]